VDDYEPWRRFLCPLLEKQPELQIVGEAADGLEAVQRAQELHPDLILLDIGLPRMNGLEVARKIRELSPQSKILFVSENRSWDIAQESLRISMGGYVVKADVARDLLPAIKAVLQGKRFVSTRLAGHDFAAPADSHTAGSLYRKTESGRHAVQFYLDDASFLHDLTLFVGAALRARNSAIVVATESHRADLLSRLQAHGLDIDAAIEQGRYVALDAADTLSAFMLNGMPDSVRFLKLLGELIVTAAEAAKGEQPRVAVFGECVHLLCAQGSTEAAIQMEKLGNQLVKTYDMEILCAYSLNSLPGGMDGPIFQQICAEHSAVYSP